MEKYVKLGIILTGILVWILMASFYQTVIGWINPDWDRMLIGQQFTFSDLLGLLTGLAVLLTLLYHRTVNKLGMEVAVELQKVTWPKWAETRVTTIVVIIVTLVISFILAFFDLIWGHFTSWMYRL